MTTCAFCIAGFLLLTVLAVDVERKVYFLYYTLPIGIPFIVFLFDRYLYRNRRQEWIDICVVTLALIRSIFLIPLISGHALFLTYALLTTHTWAGRFTAAVILLEVAYFKIVAWGDNTFVGGVLLGFIAAVAYFGFTRKRMD